MARCQKMCVCSDDHSQAHQRSAAINKAVDCGSKMLPHLPFFMELAPSGSNLLPNMRKTLESYVRRREPPTPYGRDPGRRGVRSPGTGGRCGPFGTVIRHPVPPPQSPTRRPPRQLPVSAVKARQCPRLRPSAPRPCTFEPPSTA